MALNLNHFNILQTISFIYVFITFILFVSSSTSIPSLDEECLALFQFKQSILHQDSSSGVPDFQKFTSWKVTSNASDGGVDCCWWDGVVCSDEEGEDHVIGLDLSESFLHGPISVLFSLVHLQRLNLAMNDFVDFQIPSEIGSLKSLQSLNLSASGFSGQIPLEISQLKQLSSLDLSWNPLELRTPSLEHLVQNLTKLEELNLSGVDISSSVPHSLSNFSSLTSLKLWNCRLQNEFPISILQHPKLKFLDVANNPDLAGSMPEFLNSSLLEHLFVWNTSFYGNIPESVGSLSHLITLDLSECAFFGRIPGSIANLTQLNFLGLDNNEFTGRLPLLGSLLELTTFGFNDNEFDRGSLPDWLSKLTKLEKLYASQANLYGTISPFLANITNLRFLELSHNYLSGHLPSSFMNFTQLRLVYLANNLLEGPPSSFSVFKSCQDLQLNNNNFQGRVDLDMFQGFNKLKTLLIGFNKLFIGTDYTNDTLPVLENLGLASCNLKEFPAFLLSKHNITSLFLDHNKIGGLIPVWIWSNSQETLEAIDLSHNFITGFQHPHFLSQIHLKVLIISNNMLHGWLPVPPQTTIVYDVSNNNLIGNVPPSLCEVKSLRLLDLSSNNMNGTLPPCLGGLSNSLMVLDLKRNKLHGTLMNTFMQECQLKMIDLSENQFEGQVSRSLENCTSLEILSLGDNSFDDVFPSWMGSLVKLQVLILRSNKFHGAIEGPRAVGSQFPKLRIVDFSNNGFTGELPQKYFETWNAMKSMNSENSTVMKIVIYVTLFIHSAEWPYSMTLTNKGVKREYQKILDMFTAIDLSSNNFEGEISQSLQDLQGLESLNISNNHLTGRILPSFGSLKNLESLDLSQNKLSGEIPKQLLQLNFLAILNLSFNYLHGTIPQGEQFDTFENNSYLGNPRLCGKPLSKVCGNSIALTPPTTIDESESLLPNGKVDWMVMLMGLGSGIVVGIIVGNFLYTRYSEKLNHQFKKKNGIRLLSSRRGNQVHGGLP